MNLKDAILVRTLIWYDGPLLSLYQLEGRSYLVSWVDVFEKHVWLIIHVDSEALSLYLTKKLDLLNVIRGSQELYISNGHIDEVEFEPMEFEALPEDWLPSENAFYFGDEDEHE